MNTELQRGRNKNGLCATENCQNPFDAEMLHGYGPIVMGYLCKMCGTSLQERLEIEKAKWLRQEDEYLIRYLRTISVVT